MDTLKKKSFLQRATEEIQKWKLLTHDVAEQFQRRNNTEDGKEKGSITIVGSGIMCVGHFTLEALGYIKTSDRVFFCVADPVTELYIKDLRPDAMDLYVLYDDDKERYTTYVQMSEVMLSEARKGLHVVGIFYGHPGVFVLPSHRAIQIAEKEGMKCRMLAAPSAEDCLFSDLGIDPSFPGYQGFEATDLLLRNRPISTDLHVVIWQVGCVGDPGFRFNGFGNDHLPELIKRLQNTYGSDYILTHYIAAQYPVCDSTKEKIKLSDLTQPEFKQKVTAISTFYLPPKDGRTTDPVMANTLGFDIKYAKQKPITSRSTGEYSEKECNAVKNLEDWSLPENYLFSVDSAASEYIRQHSIDPTATALPSKMNSIHRNAIVSKHPGIIRASMKRKYYDVPTTVAKRICTDGNFAALYFGQMKTINDKSATFDVVTKWLTENGYDTTTDDVQTSLQQLMDSSLMPWSNSYTTNLQETLYIDGVTYSSAAIVMWGAEVVKAPKFSKGTLSWSAKEGNRENGEVSFQRKVTVDEKNLDNINGEDVQKIKLVGYIWNNGEEKPKTPNLNVEMSPTSTIPLSTFDGQYTLIVDGNKNKKMSLIIDASHGSSDVSLNGERIKNYRYSSGILRWTSPENQHNAVIYLLENRGKDGIFRYKLTGKLWVGDKLPNRNNLTSQLTTTLTPWLGRYKTRTLVNGRPQYGPEIRLEAKGSENASQLYVGGVKVKYELVMENVMVFTMESKKFQVQFYQENETEPKRLFGYIWKEGSEQPQKSNFSGEEDKTGLSLWSAYYKSTKKGPGDKVAVSLEFNVSGSADGLTKNLSIGGQHVQELQFNNPVLSWNHKDNSLNGEITFYIKKNSRVRRFCGKVWTPEESKPKDSNINGIIDDNYMLSWSGIYQPYSKHGDKFTSGGPILKIRGATTQQATHVLLDGQQIVGWTYNNPTMCWNSPAYNEFDAELRFTFDGAPKVYGKLWKRGENKPTSYNWMGTQKLPAISPRYATSPRSPYSPGQRMLLGMANNVIGMATFELLKLGFRYLERGEKALAKKCFKTNKEVQETAEDVESISQENEPTPESVSEPAPEPVPEPALEPAPEPIAEPATKPAPELEPEPAPAAEPNADPATEAVVVLSDVVSADIVTSDIVTADIVTSV